MCTAWYKSFASSNHWKDFIWNLRRRNATERFWAGTCSQSKSCYWQYRRPLNQTWFIQFTHKKYGHQSWKRIPLHFSAGTQARVLKRISAFSSHNKWSVYNARGIWLSSSFYLEETFENAVKMWTRKFRWSHYSELTQSPPSKDSNHHTLQ